MSTARDTTLAALESELALGPPAEQAASLLDAMAAHHRATASGSAAPLARTLHRLGHARLRCGQDAAALGAWREAAELLAQGPLDDAAAAIRMDALIDQGGLFCAARDGAAAEPPLQAAIAMMQRDADPTARLVWALNLLATAYSLSGRKHDALTALRQAEAAARTVAHETRSARDASTWALLLNNIGRAELAFGRPEDACVTLGECLNVTRELVAKSGTANDLTLHSAVSNKYGKALEQTGRLDDALPYYAETVAIMRKLVTGGRSDLAHDLEHVEEDLDRLQGKLGAA